MCSSLFGNPLRSVLPFVSEMATVEETLWPLPTAAIWLSPLEKREPCTE